MGGKILPGCSNPSLSQNGPFSNYLWPLFQSDAWSSNEFMNENLFSYERMSTRNRFEKRLKVNRDWPVGSSFTFTLKTRKHIYAQLYL